MAGYVFLVLISFVGMEAVAWTVHKYLMHGALWYLHKDHHQKEPGIFEKNDWFFVILGTPGMVCILVGLTMSWFAVFAVGLGISLYGLTYFLVHDVFIHQRIKWFKRTRIPYFISIRKAHKVHHKQLEKYGSECFGMLLVPGKYFRHSVDIASRK